MRLSRRQMMVGAAVIAGGAPKLPGQSSAALPAMTVRLWRDDLAYMYGNLRANHRDLFHFSSEARFSAAISDLHRCIPDLRPFEIIAGLQSIVALAGDGHTFLFTWELQRALPLQIAWFGDEARVIRTTPEAKRLLGLRVDRIGGLTVQQASGRLNAVIPQGENAWFVLAQRAGQIRRAELLAALGVTASADSVQVAGADPTGAPVSATLTPMPLGATDDRLTASLGPIAPRSPDPDFAWSRLPNHDAVHLNFRSYGDLPMRAAALFRDLRAKPPRLLLIDLRENGGGNYALVRDHIIGPLQNMPMLNRTGRLFVLIGRATFSAAMTNATDFRRETEALLVGEPTGARPNGFQELHTFTLPNSKLKVACSIRRYRFDDAGRDAVYPDVEAAPDWADFAQGRDRAIEAALARRG